MHKAMKRRLPSLGEDPFLTEKNVGFAARFADGRIDAFNAILDDAELLCKHDQAATTATVPKQTR